MIDALLQRPVLKAGSYPHSVVYAVLLWAAITDRESVVSVLGWVHGVGWIVMSLLCLAAVRRRTIPLWLGVMVAVVGFLAWRTVQKRKKAAQPPPPPDRPASAT